MAATGLVYGEGCWGWGEIVIVLEARTAAKGKVMSRLSSGFEWLSGRRRALVRYVRHKYVETGANGLRILCKCA